MPRTRVVVIVLLLLGVVCFLGTRYLPRGDQSEGLASVDPAPQAQKVPEAPVVAPQDLLPLKPGSKPLQEVPKIPPRESTRLVYLAPLAGSDESQTTAANNLDGILRFYLRAGKDGQMPVNLVPMRHMYAPYRREFLEWNIRGHKPEEYLRDAALLDCDLVVGGDFADSGSSLSLHLVSTNLRTSATKETRLDYARSDFPALLGAAIKEIAAAGGLTEAQCKAGGLGESLPRPETWVFYQKLPDKPSGEECRAALNADPDCPLLYSTMTDFLGERTYVDEGLRKWPDDRRLIRSKYMLLRAKEKPFAAFVLLSEALRRYPLSVMDVSELHDTVGAAYVSKGKAAELPLEGKASVEYTEALARVFPDYWHIQWDHAAVATSLAWYCRGSETADKVSGASWQLFHGLLAKAVKAMETAEKRRPDCSDLLRASLLIHFGAGEYDLESQRETLRRIHELDPSAVSAELQVAYSHSVGWTGDNMYLPLIREAIDRHSSCPQAMAAIAQSLATDLHRRELLLGTPEDAKFQAGEEQDLMLKCAEVAIAGKARLENHLAYVVSERWIRENNFSKLDELLTARVDSSFSHRVAYSAFKANDYERAARLWQNSFSDLKGSAERETAYYQLVKSLWKLKRYDESLAFARKGFGEFPDKQPMHYMFAVVALENGSPLEEAYEHAYRAVDILTTNTGCNETFEKLRVRLNKPPHPKLKPQT